MILEKLGGGGMGVVYRAEDIKLKRTVALKFLPPELTRDEEAKKRFIREAQAASALQHHNICTIHEIDETLDGQLFICMDCYEGETLKQKIVRGRLLVKEAVDIAIQIAEGLSKAHEAGMVHRDVTPANIMVTRDGEVKILDFGLAKLAGQTRVTRTGMTVGTVAYMSPEQAKGEELDARSDIFSLGVVLYEMLTGETPFPGEHEAAVLYEIMNIEPKPLAGHRSSIPGNLQGVIDKALKKHPTERYQSVLEFRDDLEAVRTDFGEDHAPHGRMVARARGARGKSRTRRIFAVAAAVVLVAALASILLPRLWKPAPGKTKPALAVMDFRDLATPNDPIVSAGITELVNVGLIQADVVRIISSDLLHDLCRRLFGSSRGSIDESQTIEIARKAGATLFLTGTIRQSGAGKLVTWHLVDARSGDDVKAGRVDGTELAILADRMIAEAIPQIARKCGVQSTSAPATTESVTTESPRAYRHYMAGLLATEQYARKDDAITEFERAVGEDSTFALAYLWLARMYWAPFGYEDPQKAKDYLEKASRLRFRLGIKDQMRLEELREELYNQVEKAIATLREMRERWPDDRQTLRDLTQGLWFQWYFTEMMEVSEEGRDLYSDDIVIGGPLYLASLVAMGRAEDALRATRSYVKQHPNEPNSWDELGARYLALGLPDSAETAFHKAVGLDPDWSPENFSYCAYHRGDLAGAIRGLKNILARKDLSADRRRSLILSHCLQMNLAALYVEAGRYREAVEACGAYMAPLDQQVVSLFLDMDKTQEVIKMDQQGEVVDGLRGQVLVATGDIQGARAVAKKLLESECECGGGVRWAALATEVEADLAEHNAGAALELMTKATQNGIPFGGFCDICYRMALARAYRMDGRLDEAAKVHKEMLRIYGGHALSHYELGTIYEEMKRPAGAKKEYTKFLEMWSEADKGLPQLVDARKRLAAL
ncbi:MAG TPA: protein kinase [Candidatus Bathyarchaeia archaeon]|nr:protein kinase [Candidatus Bathyarchaeia archaeon]